MIDWTCIDSVFLDMDGTLLDLRFDNHFWLEHLPRRYGQRHGLAFADARDALLERYRAVEGRLEWYCIEHWTRELDMDILGLKREVERFIAPRPWAFEFLTALDRRGLRRVLVTNAHPHSLTLKLERTGLGAQVERILSSHTLGTAKEAPGFWPRVQAIEPFDPERTLFVDDSLGVLRAARDYGFRWLLAITRPDSQVPPRRIDEFQSVDSFAELLPGLSRRRLTDMPYPVRHDGIPLPATEAC